MKPRFVSVRYSRVLPHPLGPAFAWLTDYQDDDASRTTAVVRRRTVKKREGDVITLEGEVALLGGRGTGIAEVRLAPPDRWTATLLHGAGKGSVYEYRLTPVAGGVRLDVDYRVRVKRPASLLKVVLARPLVRRSLARMWDGFAASMARDLAVPENVRPAHQ